MNYLQYKYNILPPLENVAVLSCETYKLKNVAIALPLLNDKAVKLSTLPFFKSLNA